MKTNRQLSVRAAIFLILILAGCAATSTIESRRQEKFSAYDSLPPEQKQMVDSGQVRVGMPSDAVYIAWGKPSEVLESEDTQGHLTIWRYFGSTLQETRYWAYREVPGPGRRGPYLERYLTSDYTSRDYVRAEIVFKNGQVASWRTLPKPLE